jgi:hypothetical protein
MAVNMRAGAQRNIFMPEGGHLRQSQSGLHRCEQEGMIATT